MRGRGGKVYVTHALLSLLEGKGSKQELLEHNIKEEEDGRSLYQVSQQALCVISY